jgi:hypothetical protein
MNLQEIRQKYDAARVIRVPRFDPNLHPREKIDAMERYLNDTAFHRGELEDALWWLWEAEKYLLDLWANVEGYEPFLPSTSKERTEKAIMEAKRRVDPELHANIAMCGRLKEGIGRQIRRLELDDRNVSRTYSLATGS